MRYATNRYSHTRQFANGFGVSIICNGMSYGQENGLFEVALLNSKGELIYDERLGFEDVVGSLDFQGVADVIRRVEAFQP